MKTYWTLDHLVVDGQIVPPGSEVKLEEGQAQSLLRRKLLTKERPVEPPPAPVKAYKVLSPVQDNSGLHLAGEIVNLPSDRGERLVQAGVLQAIAEVSRQSEKREE